MGYHSLIIELLLEKFGDICPGCKEPYTLAKPPSLDHRTPVSRGGDLVAENIWLLCKPCNANKGALSLEAWEQRPISAVKAVAMSPPKPKTALRPKTLKQLKALWSARQKQPRGLPCLCGHPSGRHSETRGRCWMCDGCKEFLLDPEPNRQEPLARSG